MDIKKIIIASESQHSWRPLSKYSFDVKKQKELAQYLPTPAQNTELLFSLGNAANKVGIDVEYIVMDNIDIAMEKIRVSASDDLCVWIVSDGRIFHSSNSFSAWLNAVGINSFGIDTTIQSITDNKYLMSVIAQKQGIPVPTSYLYQAGARLSMLDGVDNGDGFFVKPNELGSQIGISTSSRVCSLKEAVHLSTEIYEQYGVNSIIQAYISGDDHRVGVIETSNSGLQFSCSKVTIVSGDGMKQTHSTNRTVNNRKWLLEPICETSRQSYIEASKAVDAFFDLGFISDYSAIDMRGTEAEGYVFLENNVKPFVDSAFDSLASDLGFNSIGDMFLDSILRPDRYS